MDIATLVPKFVFGLRTDIEGNVHHISEEEILYPAGGLLVVHNFAAKRQKYLRLPDKGYYITLICVSPNKRVIAIAESTKETVGISIYDSTSLKRRRYIPAPLERGLTSKTIECMAFTVDSKTLLVVYGEPDWIMVSYKYDRGKIENHTRANNLNNTGTVKQIACNPNDMSVVALVGDVLFRMLAVNDNVWRQFGYSKAENLYLKCAAWISQERLLAGTSDGKLLAVENGELKLVIDVEDAPSINFHQRDESMLQMTSATQLLVTSTENVNVEIRCLLTFSKGFIVECGYGKIYLFEKESPNKFKKRNLFILDEDLIATGSLDSMDDIKSIKKENSECLHKIHCVSLSPTQDYLVISCGIPQLFQVYLWGLDITRQPEIKFQELGPSLHRHAVQDIALCTWKPLLITVSRDDRSIRLWNYETLDLIMYRRYQEDIYGVDLHPTGLYAIVGFAGKLKFLTLLIDDFAVTREFVIRYCSVCRFSNQGHIFAAVNGNVIQIYSSITFENILNLKGHNGKVTEVCWTANDSRLLSCGSEGVIYEWEILTGKRVEEIVIKTCSFTGCRITSDGRISYAVGSDGEIKEVITGIVRTQHFVDSSGLDSIALSNSDQMMFISGKQGNLLSVKLPLSEKKEEHIEFLVHNKLVPKLRITFDDKHVISCSVDGSLCIWKIMNIMGRAVKVDKDYEPSVDILIPFRDLEEKIQMIKDLNMRMCELDKEHAYQIRQIETSHSEKMGEVHDAYKEVIETLKDKNNSLETEHIQEMHNINMDIVKMKRDHDLAIENLEATYNEKLINEYNKYSELEDKIVRIRKAYDTQLEDVAKANEAKEETIRDEYKQQLLDKDGIIEELKDEMHRHQQDHEVIKQQIEDDADREIFEMKMSHETLIKSEQSMNIKLRAENGIFQKKLTASMKEGEELKHTIFTLENDQIKFKNIINGLDRDIAELKKEISERDDTITMKERKIFQLKKKTQELEKYKFVLDFKIAELRAQIEPRERKIHDQKEEIQEMITELENLQKHIVLLGLQINELKEKLNASNKEFKREQNKFLSACEMIKQMRTDLHHASGFIQDNHKLKTLIKEMYHKYNADKEFAITREEDCESKNEFLKQRHYLEKSIAGLKRTVSKRFDKNEDKLKMMEEGTQLISEVNILRSQLKSEQRKNRQMESILGFTKRNLQPREAQKRLAEAVKTRQEIHKEYATEIAMDKTRIKELKAENTRLAKKIAKGLEVPEIEQEDDDIQSI